MPSLLVEILDDFILTSYIAAFFVRLTGSKFNVQNAKCPLPYVAKFEPDVRLHLAPRTGSFDPWVIKNKENQRHLRNKAYT